MTKARLVLEKQGVHLASLAGLLMMLAAAGKIRGFYDGDFLGHTTRWWLWLAVINAVIHQVYVWLCWRTELYLNWLTGRFGQAAFAVYAAGFAALILLRPLLALAVALSNRRTLPIDPVLGKGAAFFLLLPVIYLLYSVLAYFGFTRAAGADHFDPAGRKKPLVREGIFRYTPNAMYFFGFLLFWAVALYYRSAAALALALFSHAYIWVHYFCTERPDMEKIYGKNSQQVPGRREEPA